MPNHCFVQSRHYFGRLLVCVIAGFLCSHYTIAAASACNTEQYQQYGEKLDKSQVESVSLMTERYIKITAGVAPSCQSSLFSTFRLFYYQAMEAFDDSKDTLLDQYPLPARTVSQLNSEMAAIGWVLGESEGTYYIAETGDWMLSRFGKYLPEDWKLFLRQREMEISEKFSEDAGLLISWDELRERIIFWEGFLKKYPGFNEKATAEYYLSIYLSTYLSGMDNTRIYDFTSNKIDPDLVRSYRTYIENNKSSKYHGIINAQYEILKQHGFIYSEDVGTMLSDLHKRHGIETMLGYQPPAY